MQRPLTTHHSPFALAALAIALACSGCAGYQVGNGSLYARDIQTVYVPMVDSESFRYDMGEKLTEAICKEIDLKTPYKVVGSPNADSVLSARVINDTKRVLVENAYDDVRDAEVNMAVQVTWADRRGGMINEQIIALPPATVDISQSADLIPEYGRSGASSQQEVIQRLAEQIVALMEQPW